jgi:hypothetical protein
VERLHGRLWNGKAKDAQISIDRIRAVMHHFQGKQGERKSIAPSRKLWTALHALDGYLTGQSDWMVNCAECHRVGLRVETAITEGTANLLVNRRMNKSQQMRWSRQEANLLLQVRCAVYNGTLGSGYGQRFHPANDTRPRPQAITACPPNLRRSHSLALEVEVHGRPRRKITGKLPPLAARAEQIEDCVKYSAHVRCTWTTTGFRCRDVRRHQRPLCVGQI